jgi:hypothetical protein
MRPIKLENNIIQISNSELYNSYFTLITRHTPTAVNKYEIAKVVTVLSPRYDSNYTLFLYG